MELFTSVESERRCAAGRAERRPASSGRFAAVFTTLALLLTAAGCSDSEPDSPLSHVIVDEAGPAFTVLMGVPSGSDLEPFQKTADAIDEIALLEWSDFSSDIDGLVAERILNDEYGAEDSVEDLVAAIQVAPNSPMAITWNGGVAITDEERQLAIDGHTLWASDPAAYEQQLSDENAQALDPAINLEPILNP